MLHMCDLSIQHCTGYVTQAELLQTHILYRLLCLLHQCLLCGWWWMFSVHHCPKPVQHGFLNLGIAK